MRRLPYDNYDHIYEPRSADASGEPIESLGQTTRRDLYDETHRAFAVIMLDKAGQPATYTGCYTGTTCPEAGWHAVRIVRPPDGTVAKNQFFDRAGQLIDTMDSRRVRCFE